MSSLDRMRKKQAEFAAQQEASGQPVQPPRPAPPQPPAPEPPPDGKAAKKAGKKAAREVKGVITYHCGHKVGVAYLEGTKCPGCINAARVKRNRERKAAQGEKPSTRPDDSGRLPNRAHFDVIYDAAAGEWSGTLSVGAEGDRPAFLGADTASGVFHLLRQLDQQFRAREAGRQVTG